MFAKALFSTPNLLRLYGPFREQVRPYVWAWEPDGFCRSELVREGIVSNAKSSATVRALSRTSSLLRSVMRTAFVGANLFAKALFRTTNPLRLYGPFREQVRSYIWASEPDGLCRSELVREGFVSSDESFATVRALSRTSSLLRLGMRAGWLL
ncbi:hypothetical protein GIV17_17080 [Pseudomonas syringae]|nr:hypothetical protein [Pseudomonas syringae]MCF5739630.1 hypothetical protein [Pseudomonas syringae]